MMLKTIPMFVRTSSGYTQNPELDVQLVDFTWAQGFDPECHENLLPFLEGGDDLTPEERLEVARTNYCAAHLLAVVEDDSGWP